MRKTLQLLFLFPLLFACSSDSEDSGDCGSLSLISVQQNGSTLTFNYQAQSQFNYYEIGYDQTAALGGLSNDQLYFNHSFTTTDNTTTSIQEEGLFFYAENNTTLSFYIRAQCSNGDLTSWQGPIVLQIEEFCQEPYDLSADGPSVYWSYYYNSTEASYFQVEYGLQGFQLGSGTQITTNQESTYDVMVAAGNTYDYYVRAYCDNALGFSEWIGPVSSYADEDFNLCTSPSNILHDIEYNFFGDPVGVVFQWDMNGENSFEHVLVSDGFDPDDAASVNTSDGSGWPLYSQGLYQNTPYDFYVRAVCLDGSKTEWVSRQNIIIN